MDHTSNRSIIMLVACSAILNPIVCRGETTIFDHAFGTKYATHLSADVISKTPIWSEDAENPPVSARAAIKLADAARVKLVKDQTGFRWKRASVNLRFLDYCDRHIWEVWYEAEAKPKGMYGVVPSVPTIVRLIVMMDGSVLEPRVSSMDKGTDRRTPGENR